MGRSKGTLKNRFWSFVKKGRGCWIWTGTHTVYGYGVLSYGNSGEVKAHRLSWMINRGPIPAGSCVLHKCDVRDCVRPSHLWLGTRSENTLDMFAKGRNAVPLGSKNGMSKLTENDIPGIRYARLCGETYAAIGMKYGVTGSMIRRIITGLAWSQVEGGK